MTHERRHDGGGISPALARWVSLIALVGCVAVFLALALHQLPLPGLYYDESLDLTPMLQVMHGETPPLLRGIGLQLGERAYPLMLMDYMGSLNGYLTMPFMALLGSGVVAARVQPILFSALTIVLSFMLARAWFGRGAATLTALLLAVNPSFIWFSRQGISVTSVMTIFSLGSLLLIQKRLEIDRKRLGVRDSRLTNDSGTEASADGVNLSDKSSIPEVSKLHATQSPISNLQSLSANLKHLFFAGLLLGLGLWAKLLFLWWIVALGAMALVWWLTAHMQRGTGRAAYIVGLRENGLRVLRMLPALLIGMLIGAAPLIYYNLVDLLRQPFDLNNAHTLGLLLKSLTQTTEYGVNNRDLISNLGKAIADLNVFIDGSYFWYNGVPFSNVYAVPAFVISIIAGSALAFTRREWRKWLAVLAAIAVTVFISAFTVSGLWATHLFILVPFPQMVVAVAVTWLCAFLRRILSLFLPGNFVLSPLLLRSLAPALLCVGLLALPVSRDLWVSQQHHAELAQTGGSGRFSDAIYKLAAHLEEQRIFAPIALDWGIEKSVRVLTADQVRPEEIFGFSTEPDETFKQRVRELLKDSSRQYIVLWDRFAVYNRRKAFTEIAREMGLQVTETFIAHERSGLPVYVMLQAR